MSGGDLGTLRQLSRLLSCRRAPCARDQGRQEWWTIRGRAEECAKASSRLYLFGLVTERRFGSDEAHGSSSEQGFIRVRSKLSVEQGTAAFTTEFSFVPCLSGSADQLLREQGG